MKVAALRPEVTADDAGLYDALLDRRIPIGPATRALVARLPRAPAALTAEESELLRPLLLLGLIDGAGDAERAALRAAKEAPAPAPRVLPGARFGCAGSGQCCRVYRPGPLSEADVARLDEAEDALRAAWPEAPARPWVEERVGEDGARGRYLRRAPEGDRCVFLRDDHLCGVHAALGPAPKPDACRMYPFDAVRTVAGVRVFDVSTCSALGTTSAQGATHADQLSEVVPLLPERPRLHHPLVLLEAGLPCDFGFVLPLESTLRERIERAGPADGLADGLAAARAFVDAARAAPADLELPVALRAALAAAWDDRPAQVDAERAVRDLARVTEALEGVAAAEVARGAPLAAAFGEACGALRSFAAAAAGLAGGALPEVLQRADALPLDVAAARGLLRASLTQRLYGHRLLVQGRLRAGLLRLSLLGPLTLAAARVRAAGRGAPRVGAGDLDAGHWLVALALERPAFAGALIEVESACWSVGSGARSWLWAADSLGGSAA